MNPYVAFLIQDLLPVILTFVVPILGAVIVWVLRKIHEKTGIDIDAAQQQMLIDAIDHGIGFAEQWALNQSKVTGTPPDGAAKLDAAVKFVLEALDKLGITGKARDELVKLIEARLGLVNMTPPTPLPAPAPVA